MVAVAALALAACGSTVQEINDRALLARSDDPIDTTWTDPATWVPPAPTEYRIGPRDVLEIEVYELEETERNTVVRTRVSQSGEITLPLLGVVRADGRTADELQVQLERRLGRDFMVNPSVSVLVDEFRARTVTVLGEVDEPGTFFLDANSTSLVDALALAGGVTEDAGPEVLVVRAPSPAAVPLEASAGAVAPSIPSVQRVDLRTLIQHGDLRANCALADGDVVHVPATDKFYVSGMVHEGGAFPLRPGITVLKAIAMAGGLKDFATPSATMLIRKTPQGRTRTPLDLGKLEAGSANDLPLQPDDVIVVSESTGSRFVRGLGSIFRGLFHVGYNLP